MSRTGNFARGAERPMLSICLIALTPLISCSSNEEVEGAAWKIGSTKPNVDSAVVECTAVTLSNGRSVRISLTNRATEEVRILLWGTPFDSLRVSGEAGNVSYEGITALRPSEPSEGSHAWLSAGNSITTDYDVGQYYQLAAGKKYTVSLRSPLRGRTTHGAASFEVDCGSGELHPVEETSLGTVREPLHAQSGCTAAQTSEINGLAAVAASAARLASTQTSSQSPLYKEWFGDWSSGNGNTVKSFMNRYLSMDYEVRCGGSICAEYPSALGLVDHSAFSDDRLYVCPPWWFMPSSSGEQQSQVGTLIHEHTHLDPDGRDDINDGGQCGFNADLEGNPCYGAANARSLAKDPTCTGGSSSCKAVRNAENYAFFAANALVRALGSL
jgi:hypothetical protein